MNQVNTDQIFCLKKQGFAVFPLAPNSKIPLKGVAWKEWAEQADELQVLEVLAMHPEYNWGIFLGLSGHCAVDLDGQEGIANWKGICNGTPETMTVLTPRGGRHLYFKGSLPPTQGKLAAKIDTRGENSYVVAPGSVIDGKMYEVLNEREPVAVPVLLLSDSRDDEVQSPALPLSFRASSPRTLLHRYGKPFAFLRLSRPVSRGLLRAESTYLLSSARCAMLDSRRKWRRRWSRGHTTRSATHRGT